MACRALGEGLKNEPKILHTLFIENCNITDSELADILNGATHLRQLDSLTLKKTDFGSKSIIELENIFSKPFPC